MERTQEITEVGVDSETGNPVGAWRSTVTVTTSSFDGARERTDVYYVFHWERDRLGRSITLGAETPAQRDSIAGAYTRSMRFLPPSADRAGPRPLEYPPSRLISKAVSSFTVATPEYTEASWVLVFGDAQLVLGVVPDLSTPAGQIRWGDAGYYDACCRLVGARLLALDEYIDRGLYLEFSNGTALSVLAPFYYTLEEQPALAAMYSAELEFSWHFPYDFFAPDSKTSLIGAAHTLNQYRDYCEEMWASNREF
jgi:hypothetical protein